MVRLVSIRPEASSWSWKALPARTLAAESLREEVIRLAEHSLAKALKYSGSKH